jgi:TonB family protein
MLTTFALSLAGVKSLASSFSAQDTPPTPGGSDPKLITLLNEKLSEAKAACDAGDWSKAIAVLQKAIALDSSRDLLWFKLGEAYRGAKRYPEAAGAYNRAIAIKPVGAYYNNLGEVNIKLGNLQDALQAYRTAVHVDPQNASQYYSNIGAVETNAGDLDDANEAYDEAIWANSQAASAYYFKGTNLLNEARIVHGKVILPDGAIGALRNYLYFDPDGRYADISRQLIDFLEGTIVTTYAREESSNPYSGDQGRKESAEASTENENQGPLVRRIEPSFPALAQSARVQGPVILNGVIGKDGNILSLSVLSGNPLLVESAIDAVRQWKYKPFMIGGQPVDVETQIEVNFILSVNASGNLGLQAVLQLLQGGTSLEKVTGLIQRDKVCFELTEAREHRLRAAGANDSVVLAIRNNRE